MNTEGSTMGDNGGEAGGDNLIFFDGFCLLCEGVVQTILKADKKGTFRFSPIQSRRFNKIAATFQPDEVSIDSVVFISGGKIYRQSRAVFRIAGLLGFPWRLLGLFSVLPLALTDWLYEWVARNRYGWFGKKTVCFLPEPKWKSRFLDDLPEDAEKF